MFQRLSEGDFCSAAHRKLYETEQQEITAARMRDGEHWGERTHSRTMQRRLADPKAKTGALAEYVLQRPTLQPRPAAQLPSMAQESPALPPASLPTSSGLLPEILESQGISVPSRIRRPGASPEPAPHGGLPDLAETLNLAETVKLAVPVELLRVVDSNTPETSYANPYAAPEQPPAEFGLPGLASTAAWLESAHWSPEVPAHDPAVETPAQNLLPEPYLGDYPGPTAFDPAPGLDPLPAARLAGVESLRRMLEVAPWGGPEPVPVLHRADPSPVAAEIAVWPGATARAEDLVPASTPNIFAPPPPSILPGRLAGRRAPSGSPFAPSPSTAMERLKRRGTRDGDPLRFPEVFQAEGLLRWEPAFHGALASALTIRAAGPEALPCVDAESMTPQLPPDRPQLAGPFLSSRYGKRIYRLPVPQPVNPDLRLVPELNPYGGAVPLSFRAPSWSVVPLTAPQPAWKRSFAKIASHMPKWPLRPWAAGSSLATFWRSAPPELRWLAAGVPVVALLVAGFAVWSTRPIPVEVPPVAAMADTPPSTPGVEGMSEPASAAPPRVAASRPRRTAAASDVAAREMQAAVTRFEKGSVEPLPEPDSRLSGGWSGDLQLRWSRLVQRIASRAAVAYVDDFRSGLSRWAGRGDWARNWSYDQLGFIRPGGLAVYEPSLSLRDYRMEFLALLEQGGVSWAYRVMDWRNYYAGRLLVSDDSGMPILMVEHFAVVNGRVSRVERKVLPAALRPESFYRIKVDVSGSRYSVYLQGTLIDHWTDERLPAGGTGFFASKGDAARIRWMEVSHQYDLLGRVCASLVPEPLRGRQGG